MDSIFDMTTILEWRMEMMDSIMSEGVQVSAPQSISAYTTIIPYPIYFFYLGKSSLEHNNELSSCIAIVVMSTTRDVLSIGWQRCHKRGRINLIFY